MSESCSKCAKASENASSVSSAHCELVSSQLVLCEEQWSCAAPGAHTSANCAGVTACSQAFPFICPGGIRVSAPAQLCWLAPEAGNKAGIPPTIPCTCLHRGELLFLTGKLLLPTSFGRWVRQTLPWQLQGVGKFIFRDVSIS